MFSRIFKKIFQHKLITAIILILVIGGSYFGYQHFANNKNVVRYALAAVEKSTLIVSVSGSGQVSPLDEADIKAQTSGDLSGLYISNGDEIKKGKLIAKLDDTDLRKAVQNAQISLEIAQTDLEDLVNPPNQELNLLQAENDLTKAQVSEVSAEDGIQEGLESALNNIATIFFNLPTIVTTTRDVLYSNQIGESEPTVGANQENLTAYGSLFAGTERNKIDPFVQSAINDYQAAQVKYDQNLADYKNISRYSDEATIESLVNETIETTKALSEATKSEINLLDFVSNYLSAINRRVYSKITSYQTSLESYYSQTNGFLQTLYSVQDSFKNNKQALADAEISVQQKESSLNTLKAGPTELDVKTEQFAVQQKEDALSSAEEDLANASIYVPFDGVISVVDVKNGDSISNGTVIAHVITKQKIAEISLNEVDEAKVKVGQKATLTFDAIPDLSIAGEVIDINTVGQVSQGVVSYGVKISFDTQDERVKPGMSVTADIITDAKQDVLVVPNNAVKSQGSSNYVELVDTTGENTQQLLANTSGVVLSNSPKSQTIETGLSNDTSTEIVLGLNEGDIVVTSTISSNASTSSSSSSSSTNRTNQTQGGAQQFRMMGL